MLQYEQLRLALEELEPEIKDLAEALGLPIMEQEIAELETKAAQPDFWNDMENSQKVLQRTSMLKDKVNTYRQLAAQHEDALALVELADEDGDLTLLPEAEVALE